MRLRRLINFTQERIRYVGQRSLLNDLVVNLLPRKLALTAEAGILLKALQSEGNVVMPPLATPEELQRLKDRLSGLPCFDPWHPERGEFTYEEAPETTNNARIRGVSELPEAVAVANSPLVLSVVSNYLGCLPTIDDIVAWWSIPARPVPVEEQFFHRDNDALKFVKLFVYLTDVDVDDGAHVFVAGSHRVNRLLERRRRYVDEEVLAAFDAHLLRPMTGAFGTAFLEDTYGLHKGTVPRRTPRLLFQVRYTSYPSVFARPYERTRTDWPYDGYINRYVA